jgi:large repetitive protein
VNTLTYGDNTLIAGLALTGGSGTVNVGSHITGTAGHSVAIANRTGGTTSFSGAVDDTGTGISLTNNTGATIAFSGGVTSGAGVNSAFSATGGGTVTVTGTGNMLSTSTGTALNVANTTIGTNGLTFRSITSNGGAGGIVLNNTGSSGGLTVTGSGTAGSGGTIQHKTGADGTTDGIGIYLNNTSSVSLARMQLNDFDNFAIRGTGVSGFTLSNSTINGSNGTSTAADEASVAFDNLTGSASITNDTITGGVEDDVRIQNTTGSLSSLGITGSTFATTGAATANDALALIGRTGASVFNATVQGNTFARAQGDLFQYTLEAGTGTMHFDSNTVTNNFPTTLPAGGGDINVSSASTASPTQSLQYSINDNDIYSSGTGGQPPNGSVIVVAATPQGSATGTIQNNTIGTTGVTQSGGFDAILADAVKAGFHKVTITGNTIRRYKEAGIRLLGVSPAAPPGFNLRATVKGNVITEPDSIAFAGIDAEVGADPADVGTMCLDLGGATAAEKNSVSNGDPGNFNDINLIQQFATRMNLPGYAGAATDDAAVRAFVAGRNDGDGAPTVSAIHDAAGSGFTGTGTDCS